MKKNYFYLVVAVLAVALSVSCNGLKKMNENIEKLGAKCEPNPLEVHGDKVAISITGKFPAKYFDKKVYAEGTPVLVGAGGSETKMKMAAYQGEKAAGNGKVVPYKTESSFTYTDEVDYKPEMAESKLYLRLHGKKGSKEADLDPVFVADGVITTPYLIKTDAKCIQNTEDKFVRTVNKSMEAQVNFDYNSSNLKPAELKEADIAELGKFLDSCSRNPKLVVKSIEFISYASPEGELLLNDELANERAEAGKKVLTDMVKKMKLTNVNETMFSMSPKGEDWDGFRDAMEKSNIDDRNIIINVLQMTKDLQAREQEIKNISKTYTQIQKDIFPSLRRCRIVVNYSEEGYSDAELLQLAATNPSVLKYEELMKAGLLNEDLAKDASIYAAAAAMPDADYRASNNLGCTQYMQSKIGDAEASWKKAYGMKKCAETSNNMGVATWTKGDRTGAATYYGEAGSGKETSYNKGLLDIQSGSYGSAITNMGSYKTFNSALAKLLNKDYTGAKSDMDASGDTSAMADYLRAIIAARSGEPSSVGSNLKSAVQKDSALGSKAKKDLEFRNFQDQMTF
ncbi:MAG: hypothetical protein ACKVOR_03765 [Flavobacteriales bacterium]